MSFDQSRPEYKQMFAVQIVLFSKASIPEKGTKGKKILGRGKNRTTVDRRPGQQKWHLESQTRRHQTGRTARRTHRGRRRNCGKSRWAWPHGQITV